MSKQDDQRIDELFKSLYETALLDEDFQQQRIHDLQQILAEKQPLLNAKEHAFISNKQPSTALIQQLTQAIHHHQTSMTKNKKPSFWEALFSRGKQRFSFLSLGVTIPSALAFGMLFGVLFAPLFTTPTPYTDTQFRGADNTDNHETTAQQSMEENPQYWLRYIANLLEKGKLTLATDELQRFKQHYPNFEQNE
jgi:hypothetical protein